MTETKNTTLKAQVGDQTVIKGKIWNIVGSKMVGPKTTYTLERTGETATHTFEMSKKNYLYRSEKSGQHKV